MDGEDFAWWWGEGDWYDRRQRHQIEALEASVSGAYSQASRLRSQLSKVQGTLQSKLDRLASAFDAFVELSDVRAELAVFTDAAIVRHQVRMMLATITSGRTPAPPDLPEVAGYWLVPAARALHARLDGDGAAAARHTEAATELAGDRSRYFLAAAARLAGPVDLTAVELAALLPTANDSTVHRAGRAFWQATAAGAFGDAGRALLISALSSALGRPDGASDDAINRWTAMITGVGAPQPGAVVNALVALRQRWVPLPDGFTPAGTAPTAGGAAPAGDTASATADEPQVSPSVAPLIDVIRSLIDEGYNPERDLLRRAEKLRGLVENGMPPNPYRAWDEAVGELPELIRSDVFSAGTAEVARQTRTVAIRAAAPWLLTAVDRIAERGRVAPAVTGKVRVRGREIRVDGNGLDRNALADLRRSTQEAYRPERTKLYAGVVVGVLGLLVTIIGFATDSVLLDVLGIAALLVGAGVAIAGWREISERASYVRQELADLDRAAAREVEAFKLKRQQDARQRERIDSERAALAEVLT